QDAVNDFSVNIPLVSYDTSYKELLVETIDKLIEYPEIDGATARQALSTFLNWPKDEITLGNGATDLIYLVARAFKFQVAMVLNPTFSEYQSALEQAGTKVVNHVMKIGNMDKTLTFEVDAHELARHAVDNACRSLFICNPNNPTGQFFSTTFLESFLIRVDKDFVLIIDESFIEFRSREAHHKKMCELVKRYNILVIRSMTKTYSVPGLRMGYAFGNANLMQTLNRYRDPWALNRFALESIPYFLKRKMELAALQDHSIKALEEMRDALMQISGLDVSHSEANFLLIRVQGTDPVTWHERMIDGRYYLRTCMDFIGLGPEYFRVVVKDKASNQKLIEAIRENMK
ncbi:MAG TPA: hypothetical protein DCS67_01890, partial [Clostridiales bacterium UBA8960]|nr:hypothetical protein [Clostridiales bacterium UBA8960]